MWTDNAVIDTNRLARDFRRLALQQDVQLRGLLDEPHRERPLGAPHRALTRSAAKPRAKRAWWVAPTVWATVFVTAYAAHPWIGQAIATVLMNASR